MKLNKQTVFILIPWRGTIKLPNDITLLDYLDRNGNKTGDYFVFGGKYSYQSDVLHPQKPLQLFEHGIMQPHEGYFLTPEELLELKKKWAAEAFDAGDNYQWGESYKEHNPDEDVELSAKDKETYINSLSIE